MSDQYEQLRGEYDLVLCGTGPTESLISAAATIAGKKVLHLDVERDYGGCRRSFTLNSFIEWAEQSAQVKVNKIDDLLEQPVRSGAYTFELMPSVLLAEDKMIQVLINAGSAEMVSMQLIDGLYFRSDNGFALIPSSKGAIFSEKQFNFKQKRNIVKFISLFINSSQYGHTEDVSAVETEVESFKGKPFRELLLHFGFTEDISDAFEYFLARADTPLETETAMKRIHEFTDSIGKYGATPLLTFLYGSSDLPQVFCRNAAVYGASFALGVHPNKVEKTEDGYRMVIADDVEIKTKHVVLAPDQVPDADEGPKRLIAHREVLLLKKPMFETPRSIAVIAPGKLNNDKPIAVYQYDSSLNVCRSNEYIVYFSSLGEIGSSVDSLVAELPEDSVVLRVAFDIMESTQCPIEGGFYVPSPTISESFYGTNYFVDQAKEVLSQIDSNIPFFPAPTEVEVEVPIEVTTSTAVTEPTQEETASAAPSSEPTHTAEDESTKTEESTKTNEVEEAEQTSN